jgi:hypothetical protein
VIHPPGTPSDPEGTILFGSPALVPPRNCSARTFTSKLSYEGFTGLALLARSGAIDPPKECAAGYSNVSAEPYVRNSAFVDALADGSLPASGGLCGLRDVEGDAGYLGFWHNLFHGSILLHLMLLHVKEVLVVLYCLIWKSTGRHEMRRAMHS